MSAEVSRKDLVLLVADKNMEASLKGLLSRPHALGFGQVIYDLYVHPERDPGCLLRSHDFLQPFASRYDKAMVLLDHQGCGRTGAARAVIESEIENRLATAGWGDRAAAIVIEPELEVWIWSDSPWVNTALGWERSETPLRSWLEGRGFLEPGDLKPDNPKEAVECALREARIPRSSAIYLQLAQHVSTERCADPAFSKLRQCLRSWFPR